MKSLCLIALIASASLSAATLEIDFTTENLSAQDAVAKVTLESTNPVCNKIYLNPMTGVAIYPRSKEFKAEISWSAPNAGTIVANYEEGGLCNYRLTEVALTFVRGKTYFAAVNFRTAGSESFQTGHLEKYEILKNDRATETTCTLDAGSSIPMCESKVEGIPSNGRGYPASFYLWREYLTGQDQVSGVHVRSVIR